MNEPRDPLLVERQHTHGDFATNADWSQRIKRLVREAEDAGCALTNVQREALDMIALKISRILSGHPGYGDHWDDIAGYAKLASEELNKCA